MSSAPNGWHRICLNIDGSVTAQKQVKDTLDEIVDLKADERNLRLYANKRGLSRARSAIAGLRKRLKGPWLSFLGSGDFNHLSALLVESLPDEAKPVNLVLIDNHPDWFDMPLKYHCGTWVATLMRQPWVESVTLIGQDSEDLIGREFWFIPWRDFCRGRVALYPFRRESTFVPLRWSRHPGGASTFENQLAGVEVGFHTVKDLGVPALLEHLSARLSGKNIYLALDKDVLSTDFALTDWEQGGLSLEDLKLLVQGLSGMGRLIGADICGEQAPSPLTGPWKRWDAGRIKDTRHGDWSKVTNVNQETNLALLELFTQNLQPVGVR
jgi:arginase family enzyme